MWRWFTNTYMCHNQSSLWQSWLCNFVWDVLVIYRILMSILISMKWWYMYLMQHCGLSCLVHVTTMVWCADSWVLMPAVHCKPTICHQSIANKCMELWLSHTWCNWMVTGWLAKISYSCTASVLNVLWNLCCLGSSFINQYWLLCPHLSLYILVVFCDHNGSDIFMMNAEQFVL